MNLIVDIGNTLVKAAVIKKGLIQSMVKTEHPDDEAFRTFVETNKPYSGIIVANVRSEKSATEQRLKELTRMLITMSHQTPVPVSIDYQSPETLGMDRLALAVGANDIFSDYNTLVISCGTAITYEIITAGNCYMGGNISPGMAMRFKALNAYSGRLPLVDAGCPARIFGTNTTEALQNGVIQGIVYEIEGTIASFNREFGNPRAILTGGDADFFANRLKAPSLWINICY